MGREVKSGGFRGPQGRGPGPKRAELGSGEAVQSGAGGDQVGAKVGAKSIIIERMIFNCPIEYEAGREYTRQEMVELIKVQRQLLCFFAQSAGYRQGVLGLDFDLSITHKLGLLINKIPSIGHIL